MRRAVLAWSVGLSLSLASTVASTAFANGRYPASNQFLVARNDPNFLLLRTTFGVVTSHDAGKTWDWVCERAVGYGGTEDPFFGITANDSIVAATFQGMSVSSDIGCSWHFIGGDLKDKLIVDLAVSPADPKIVTAVSGNYVSDTDAGPIYDTFITRSEDNGATWKVIGSKIDENVIVETVDVAKSDPNRLYVSTIRGIAEFSTASLFVSHNNGDTWEQKPIPLEATFDRAVFIGGVDPTDADRIYIRTNGSDTNRLLVSTNGGDSFQEIFRGNGLVGFTLSPDGSRIYVGSPNDGLWVASRSDYKFEKKSSIIVQCLTMSGSTLYACSAESSGFILGSSQDEGATFQPLMHLKDVRGPLACPESEYSKACRDDWPAVWESLGGPPVIRDAGGDAADASASPPMTAPSGKCDCSVHPVSSSGFLFAVTGLGLWFARSRTRRKQP